LLRLVHRASGDHFQGGDTGQRALQGQTKPAHEGQPDTLAGEGPRAGGDGQAVQCGEVKPAHGFFHHRRQPFGMAAVHGFENVRQNLSVFQ
jgi:hypothetical protein